MFKKMLISLCLIFATTLAWAKDPNVTLEVFEAESEPINSFIIADDKSAILIDAQFTNKDATALAKRIKAKNVPLKYIFITHGHPDHYLGLGYLHKTFPQADIVVANQNIKSSIKGFTQFLESINDLSVPEMKTSNFDYDNLIQVLPSHKLSLDSGAQLFIQDDYLPTEAKYLSTLYSPDLNALFVSDLVYNQAHPWFGPPVTPESMRNWRHEVNRITVQWKDKEPTIYPGHGKQGTFEVFDNLIEYMDIFEFVVRTSSSKAEAKEKMKLLYPNYAQSEFYLTMSLDNLMKEQK